MTVLTVNDYLRVHYIEQWVDVWSVIVGGFETL